MSNITPEEQTARKKAIFDNMSARGQKYILKKGYDNWDPFEEPKDPIDIRTDKTKRTSQQLIRDFLHACPHDQYSSAYGRGAFELCLGIVNDDEAARGMFDFACWYQRLLQVEGHLNEKDKQ